MSLFKLAPFLKQFLPKLSINHIYLAGDKLHQMSIRRFLIACIQFSTKLMETKLLALRSIIDAYIEFALEGGAAIVLKLMSLALADEATSTVACLNSS